MLLAVMTLSHTAAVPHTGMLRGIMMVYYSGLCPSLTDRDSGPASGVAARAPPVRLGRGRHCDCQSLERCQTASTVTGLRP